MKRLILFLACCILLLGLPPQPAFAQPGEGAALIRIYRTRTFFADGMALDVYLNGRAAFRSKAETRAEIAVPQPGKYRISAKGGKTNPITLNIVAGETYYVHMTVNSVDGMVTSSFEIMDSEQGEAGFSAITTDILTGMPKREEDKANISEFATKTPAFVFEFTTGFGVRTNYLHRGEFHLTYEADQAFDFSNVQPGIDFGFRGLWQFNKKWACYLTSFWMRADDNRSPSLSIFTGPGISNHRYFGKDGRFNLEGGISVGYVHVRDYAFGHNLYIAHTIGAQILLNGSYALTERWGLDAALRFARWQRPDHFYNYTDRDNVQVIDQSYYFSYPMNIWSLSVGIHLSL